MYHHLRSEVEKHSGDVIRFTQDLVRIPSPSLHEGGVAGKVSEVMHGLRYDLAFTDDVGNVIGVILGSDRGLSIVISSHMDTKRPETIQGWRRSPLSGDIVHGRIEGVGAAECKGALASQIYAGHVLASNCLAPKENIVVAATVVGDSGCGVGIRHLLETTLPELNMEPVFVVLGDPTRLMIGYCQDGWLEIDIDLISPVDGVARSAAEHVFQSLSAHCDESDFPGSRAIMTVEPPRAGRSDHGFLETVRLCRRLFHGESEDEVLRWLDRTVVEGTREMHAVFLAMKVRQEEQQLYTGHRRMIRKSVPPWSTDLMHPLIDRARKAMRGAGCRWAPHAGRSSRLGVGSAGGVVSRTLGIPVLAYGPGEEEQAGACNESVSLAALSDAVFGTAVLIQGLSGAPVALPVQGMRFDDERLTVAVPKTRA